MKVIYLSPFVKKFNKLEEGLQEEVLEKIELFKNTKNHKQLKVHKLKGIMRGRFSFSVNYKTRIVFVYVSKKEAAFLAIGDHKIYD